MSSFALFRFLTAISALLLSGCVSVSHHAETISAKYELRATTLTMGDSSVVLAIWGMSDAGWWKEVWPSVPICHHGVTWIVRGQNLIFIGWKDGDPQRRLVLMSSNGSLPVDLSGRIAAAATAKGLLGKDLRADVDYQFDGLVQNEKGISVSVRPLRSNGEIFKVPVDDTLLDKLTANSSARRN